MTPENYRDKRDQAAREFMHSYKGTVLEGDAIIHSAFVHGYDKRHRDELTERLTSKGPSVQETMVNSVNRK